MFKVGDRVKIVGDNEYCDTARVYVNCENLYIWDVCAYITCIHNDRRLLFMDNELKKYKKILEDES